MKAPKPPRRDGAGKPPSRNRRKPKLVTPKADPPTITLPSQKKLLVEPPSLNTAPAGNVLHAEQVLERRKERKRAGILLGTHRLLTWLGVGLAVTFVVWLIAFSSLFAVEQESLSVVTQSGAEQIDEEPALSRLTQEVGVPLLRVNTSQVRTDLQENPEVSEAVVTRIWPHGLGVELVPRIPVIAVEASTGYEAVAKDGVVVRTTREVPYDLPLFDVAGQKTPTEAQIQRVLDVRKSVPKKLRKRIDSFSLHGTTLSFELNDGVTIVWGDESNSKLKKDVLKLLMAEREAQIYDVSTPARPSTK